jgi:hypothetical protein
MSVSSMDTATTTYNNFLILLFYLLGLYFYSFTRAIVPDESTQAQLLKRCLLGLPASASGAEYQNW